MKRLGLALVAALVVALAITTTVEAELENSIFSSKEHHLRIVVPRNWRASDQPSYPGMLLWMMRSGPEANMVLTAEPFTRAVYCSWAVECRANSEPLPNKLACALRKKLEAQKLHVGPVQAGPKENEQAGMPSVWFELDDGKHFLRQAVAIGEDQVVSLTLSTKSSAARTTHVRAFDSALRTLRPLTLEEIGSALPPPIQVVTQLVDDAGVPDAGAASDAAVAGAARFESAPASKVNPIGPCPQQ
jgi:hypothetical protein